MTSIVPFGFMTLLLGVAAFVAIIVVAFAHFARLHGSKAMPCAHDTETPAREQDRQMILDMLRDGKVSGEQAADLLKALGPKAGAADRLPLTTSVIGAVAGAILIVVGFMLPWRYVRVPMPFGGGMDGYQAGYNIGYVGWIVLVAGILPALLVCIPSLDKHLRHGMLRMVIACLGGAFVIVMLLSSLKGIGLWVAAIGFALQLVTAFQQAGLAGPSSQTPSATA
jgi:hypothetical protein